MAKQIGNRQEGGAREEESPLEGLVDIELTEKIEEIEDMIRDCKDEIFRLKDEEPDNKKDLASTEASLQALISEQARYLDAYKKKNGEDYLIRPRSPSTGKRI